MPFKHSWAVLSFRTVLGARRNVAEPTNQIAPIRQKHVVLKTYVRRVSFESSSPDRLAPRGEMLEHAVLAHVRAGLELGTGRRASKGSTTLPDRRYDLIFRWHGHVSAALYAFD